VGFTKDLGIIDRLSVANLRKLIRLAIPFWKRRSTALGLIDAIRTLTGRFPVLHDWFFFRAIVGETITGEEQLGFDMWIIGGAVSRFDEFISTIRIMDDGSLDEQLVLDLVQLARPTNETIEVYLVDFLDQYDLGRGKWNNISMPLGVVHDKSKQFELGAGSEEAAIVNVVAPSALQDTVLMQKIMLNDSADTLFIKFLHFNPTNYYELEIVVGTWTLRRIVAGVPSTVSTFTPSIPFVAGTFYKIRITAFRTDAGQNQIRVFVDANKELEVLDSVTIPVSGGFRYRTPGGNGADVYVDNTEAFRVPLRQAIVAPSGNTISSNFFA
jgi:hypothetical protein